MTQEERIIDIERQTDKYTHKNNDKKRGTDREKVIRKDRQIARIKREKWKQRYIDSTNRERK